MLNPKFGASMLSWVSPQWNNDAGLYAIEKAARTGFEIIELCLPPTMQIDTKAVRSKLKQTGIQATCGLNLPKEAHIPSHPKEALLLLKKAIDKTEELEAHFLGGVLQGAIGVFTGASRTQTDDQRLLDVWGESAHYALGKGIQIGIEPINRYETYVCTSAAEVLALFQQLHAPNLVLHLDTFHMNIEENGFYDPVIAGKEKLKYIHATDSDRGMLGEANVHWDDFFRALSEINYTHPLVLENFTNQVPGIKGPTSLWRPSKYDADTLAKGSLAFLQKMVEKWG